MKEFVEKLIERLEEKAKSSEKDMLDCNLQYHKTVFGVQMNTYEKAIEIVKQLAEEYNPPKSRRFRNGWIPCSERLPEDKHDEYYETVNISLSNE